MASSSSFRPQNCSKAQTSFFKILHTISSVPPSTPQENPLIHGDDDDDDRSATFPKKSRGIDIDLNVSIYPTTDYEESESFIVNQKGKETKVEAVIEKSVGVLLRKDSQVRSFEVESKETHNVESESKKEGEGAEGSKLKSASSKVSERDELNSEELSDELRSARTTTRNTVLPDRYKDEVVVPRISTKRKQTPRMTTRNNYTRPRRIN